MNKYYIILLLAFLLKSFAGIPILLRMYKTHDTQVMPYISLIMILTSSLLLLYASISDGYVLHSIIFLLYFSVYALILAYKYHCDSM